MASHPHCKAGLYRNTHRQHPPFVWQHPPSRDNTHRQRKAGLNGITLWETEFQKGPITIVLGREKLGNFPVSGAVLPGILIKKLCGPLILNP